MASPRIQDWVRGAGTVRGTEAFWIDVGDAEIPTNYYYLVARGPVVGSLITDKSCQLLRRNVYADDRPDLTGETLSAGDYVASATGVCGTRSRLVRWQYVVAAPGFGPVRKVGIPTSGLYVVIAAASGPRWQTLLRQMLASTRFRDTSISQIVDAARPQVG